MVDKIDYLILELEELTKMLWKNDRSRFAESYNKILSIIMEIMPMIIASYANDKMADIREDALYWPGQVSKIIDLCSKGNDIIAMSDALYYELRANLVEYKHIITERMIGL